MTEHNKRGEIRSGKEKHKKRRAERREGEK